MFRTLDPVASATLQHYEHQQMLHRARRYIYIKGAVNAVIVLLFVLTFPPALKPKMVAIAVADVLFLVPYWFLVQRYPTLATSLSLGITSLAISAGDWVGGYQTGASGILYALLILGGHLVLIKPLKTYLISVLITTIYVGTIALEVNGVIPIGFPFTLSNLSRVVSLNVISMFGLTVLTDVVTRLYRELLQRNKELFALNAVSTAASKSLNLDRVLQLTLDKVLEVMELQGGGLYLLEASTGKMVLKVHRDLPGEFVGWLSRMEIGIEDFADSPFRMGQVLVVDDLSQHPVVNEIVGDENGHRPLAIVPLKVRDRTLGTMNLVGRTGYAFTSRDAELLSTIGAQIGLAIENARWYELEQDRRRMAEALRETAGVIGSTLELNEVLQLVLEQLRKVLDYYTSSIMMLERDSLKVIAVEGLTAPDEILERSYTAKEAGLSWEVIRKKQALVVADVTKYPRWIYDPQIPDVRAWIGAPLIADGEAIGLLTVDSRQVGKYSQDDAQLVMTFARQAALAIKNARLFGEMKQRFEETIALYQTSLDIPERKRAEEMLRIKDHTIASSITAIAIAEFGGNLTYVNPSFLKMWGYDNENEVLGKNAVEFWQTKEEAQEVLKRLRDEHRWTGELVAERKDGSLFDVQFSASTVTEGTGEPICMMASFVDITEHKRAEEALREAEERYRSLVESARDVIYTVSMEGTITSANAAFEKMTGWSRTEWIGKPLPSIVHPDDWPLALEMFQRMVDGEVTPLHEVRFRSKSGEYLVGEFMITPHIQYGRMVGILGVGRDITERKRVEGELRRYRDRLEELVEERTAELIKANEQLQCEIAERKQTEEILRHSQEQIARSHRLLLALSQAAQAVQRVRTPEEVYHSVGDEMTDLDCHAIVLTLTNDGSHLALTHMTFEPELTRAAEKLTGLSAQGYRFPLVPGGLFQRFIAEGETSFVEPITEPIAEAVPRPVRPLADRLAATLGLKQAIWAPLSVDGQTYGLLSMAGAGLTAADTPAVTAFANQMAIAIENTQLYQMERKRTAHLAVVNQVARRAASILDMDHLLQEVVTAIEQGFNYHNVALSLLDEAAGELEVQAIAGGFADLVSPDYRQAVGIGMVGWVAKTGQPLLANDVSQEPHYILGFIEEPLTKSELCVPLKLADKVIGVLDVEDIQLNAFDETDLLAMQTLADQIAVAIENARLYEREQKRAVQLTVVNQVARQVASILDLDRLLCQVVTDIQQSFNYHHVGLFLLDQVAGQLEMRAMASGFVDVAPPDHRLALGEGMAGWTAETGQPLLANDVSQEPRYVLGILKESLTKAELCVPLKLAGKVIGVLDIQDTQLNAFDETDLLAMETLADQLAIAIENARLFREAKRRFEETMVLYQTSLDITAQMEMKELLKSIVERAATLLRARGGGLCLYDPEQEELRWTIGYGPSEEYVGTTFKSGEGMAGKVLQTGEPLMVDNYGAWEGRAMRFEVDEPFNALLEVPLKWQDRTIGVLAVEADARERTFNQDDVWLAMLFANQAAVAIENARIYEEERKRATQLELISGITQRMASILDLDELLHQVVHLIEDTFDYSDTSILLVEANTGEVLLKATTGPSGSLVEKLRLKIGQKGITSWVAHSGEPLLANDVSREPRYHFREEAKDIKSELAVPIKLKGEIIGVLDAQSTELDAFSQDDVSILQTLADQLAIAIENAQLYQQTDEKLQTRVKELSALYAIAAAVNHSLNLNKILQLALDSAVEVTGMDSGGILLLDPSTGELFLRARRGGSPEFIREVGQIKADEGLMPRMLNSVLTIDELSKVSKDRRIAIEKEGLQSLVSVPLKAKENPLGVMVIASHSPRPLASQELELLATIGNQVGGAVDRASLQAQELRAAVLEERQDMARQMHDDTAQTLGYLGFQVDSVMGNPSLAQNVKVQTELEGLRKAIEDAYKRVRSSIIRLGEDIPEHFDLEIALPEIISEFEKQTSCRIVSKVERSWLSRLPPVANRQAIYIIREALTNVRKHSGATSVHLTLQGLEDGRVEVTIQDNGRGFDLDSEQQVGWGSFGLRFMRERAERVGGSLKIESQPGQGTRVVVSLPSG